MERAFRHDLEGLRVFEPGRLSTCATRSSDGSMTQAFHVSFAALPEKKGTAMFMQSGLTISVNNNFSQSKGGTMRNKIFTFTVLGCITAIFFAGCGTTSEQKVEQAKLDLKDAKADYLAEWQKFKTKSEEQIKANEDRIDAFKEKIEKTDTETKAKYNKAVAELEQKNRDLKKQLEEYKDEGESKWQEFKTNFSHDLDAIGKTMKDLFTDND